MNLQKGFFRLWVIGSVCWLAFMIWHLYWEHRSIKMDAWWIMNDTLRVCEELPPKSIAKRSKTLHHDKLFEKEKCVCCKLVCFNKIFSTP